MPQTIEHTETEDRLLKLHRTAGDLELALQSAMRHDTTTPLTTAQVNIFNTALNEARQLLPNSHALKEDVDTVDEMTDAASAYRALHLTLVPTLHNALPEDYAAL